MEALLNLLNTSIPLLYALAAMNYMVYLSRNDPFAKKTCTPFLTFVFVIAVSHAVLRGVHFGRYPIIGIGEALDIIALGMTAVYLYVERLQRNSFTGAFILPMIVVVQLAGSATLSVSTGPIPALLKDSGFGLHAIFAILGYSSFAVSFVYGIMYLLLYRSLRQKKFGVLFERLPSLDELANMGFWAGFFGWLALTVTIFLGVSMSVKVLPNIYQDPKFLSTVLVWGIYGTSALAHFFLGWRGARAVRLSMAGFILAVVAMMGSNFLWSTFHSFAA